MIEFVIHYGNEYCSLLNSSFIMAMSTAHYEFGKLVGAVEVCRLVGGILPVVGEKASHAVYGARFHSGHTIWYASGQIPMPS